MNTYKWKLSRIILVISIGLAAPILFGLNSTLLAQKDKKSDNQNIQNIEDIIFIPSRQQPKPPNHGTPKTSKGAGSRGDCPYQNNSTPLTSLVGQGNLTQTISEHPSFWVYVPYSLAEATTAEFILQNEERDLYRSFIRLPANIPGIIEIELPSTIAALEVDQKYRWYFEIDCSRNSNPEDITVFNTITGIVTRIETPAKLELELKTAKTDLERIKIFAKHGIWYETLVYLAQLRLKQQPSFAYERLWQNILSQTDVDLAEIAQKQILDSSHNTDSRNVMDKFSK